MKTLRNLLVLSALALVCVLTDTPRAGADEIDFDTYAAIAYSPSTGKYGYAYNYGSRYAAERAALAHCPEADAEIVGWVKAGWLALAIGDDNAYGVGWEYGEGATNTDAKRRAYNQCAARTTNPKVVLCICSGNIDPEVIE
jgi:uncharacterized protein DUF4189